jgi:predicted NAD/FAD-binding protein
MNSRNNLRIAVIGSGAAGLAAAWLLSQRHQVTLLEKDERLGGHANTVATGDLLSPQIDTGFIVYNEPSYPNLLNWFNALGVQTEASNMSFAVSRDDGNFEYAGGPKLGLLAQPSLLLRARYWRMLKDLLRFYREAPKQIPHDSTLTLGQFLVQGQYSSEFLDDHLLPFASAIWSAPTQTMLEYPAAAFIRFCDNHGLLQIMNRPRWRTVTGGSKNYVDAVKSALGEQNIKVKFDTQRIERQAEQVVVHTGSGEQLPFDQVVLATHADTALRLLDTPSDAESELLGAFEYEPNTAVLHTDTRYMPVRKQAWCSWNYVESHANDNKVCVSYWMNLLQNLKSEKDYMVTLNPASMPHDDHCLYTASYEHPVFNASAISAQTRLWSLQGQNRTWFCGSYFGSGFHEDAVQAGLAVAEHLGGVQRPWQLDNPSYRIHANPTFSVTPA